MSYRTRIREGDATAFARLFDEHARAVYCYAYRVLNDWAAAEDALSLTFLEAWRLRRKIDADGGSLRPWLLGSATTVVRNM